MPQTQTLRTLLQHEERQRDEAAARNRQAEQTAQRARDQAGQLLAYRVEYEARWVGQFRLQATMEIIHCYRSFMARLDQAVTQQQRQVELAEGRLAQSRAALLAHEQRVAAVRKLIERRQAELQRHVRARDQKHTDELAQRVHWQRRGSTVPTN